MRIVTFILVIATFVTVVDYVIQAISLDLHKALGAFISLIVVNCLILGRAEAFASKNTSAVAAVDGLGMGIGFTFALLCSAAVREILGSGQALRPRAVRRRLPAVGRDDPAERGLLHPRRVAAGLQLMARRRAKASRGTGRRPPHERRPPLVSIFVNACLVNNFVLAYFLGLCPFLGVSGKLATATRMGGAVMFVMLVSSVCAFGIHALLVARRRDLPAS